MRSFCLAFCVSPERQYETFPADTERLWHHWLHHCVERAQGKSIRQRLQEQDLYFFFCVNNPHSENTRHNKWKLPIGKPIGTRVLLTPPGRPRHISQSDWNYHCVQFWHFQKIPAEELPQVSGEHSRPQEDHQPSPTNAHTQTSRENQMLDERKKRENTLARCIIQNRFLCLKVPFSGFHFFIQDFSEAASHESVLQKQIPRKHRT